VKNLPGATGGAGEGPTNLGDGYDGPGNKKISDTLADSTWLYVYPEGFGELLKYVNKKCASPTAPDYPRNRLLFSDYGEEAEQKPFSLC
jgi:hypothetical protein